MVPLSEGIGMTGLKPVKMTEWLTDSDKVKVTRLMRETPIELGGN